MFMQYLVVIPQVLQKIRNVLERRTFRNIKSVFPKFLLLVPPQTTSNLRILPTIHDPFRQRRVHDYGGTLTLALLDRMSRVFAGIRYPKRGVSDQGGVANGVEHEQIVTDEQFSCSQNAFVASCLQIRASIPVI